MIFYLHGFRSGPQSQKVQQLAVRMEQLGLRDRLWCDQLPPVPCEAIGRIDAAIRDCLKTGQIPTLIGSSLGGFYATWLAAQ
ncbi:MAG: hypothetical protein CGU28_17195 [Candidatus Dactylopiibacterium carminicum]|uniref:Esterase n=1 Tax=Candidatus Dactylopiibacterium carminicum TaxID=857335 RepID=A0A272EMC3_9RHOO|nr:YqiA/YcfP family alpha/beta fold hydrolase [Candidatus Dactylopiibacterium carminicum]KAF7597657.1 hypothetical protein BGI27_17605 [Candidatus Dactylopiibacterium carminicum]PAS91279.1 MAG: hypothetical protein CGU29_17330 [Candidatus Dactylopiibacterium carminicum]PAS91904.1 MAG: hypothetical protein CGU28_17195 [Candidatus Dactylopiibacterium carminicum]PAS93412.1 MAG: hypothetical protein BSR46_17655 [Candidatus Dactylopiibacterium carminicum]